MIDRTQEHARKQGVDVVIYIGPINRDGYDQLTRQCADRTTDEVMLVLGTFGGDPDAAFRMARALKHYYAKFTLLVPGYCKSAGTLLALGADELVIADTGELGPLDMQLKKQDELFDMSSGLEITQAMAYMQTQALNAFRAALFDLKLGGQLTTKMASDIAVKLATGIMSPLYAQIDPYKIGESQRAIAIANAYGTRLNKKSGNLKDGALTKLVTEYPSHGFVIDRKDASDLFKRVREPNADEQSVVESWLRLCQSPPKSPVVILLTGTATNENEDEKVDGQSVGSDPEAGEAAVGVAQPENAGGDDDRVGGGPDQGGQTDTNA